MSKKNNAASENELSELHKEVARVLRQRLQDGTASAADISAAIKFLKDNNISCPIEDSEDLGAIARGIPERIGVGDFGEDIYDVKQR